MIDRYLLWLGGIFNEKAVMTSCAISPAANRWQKELLESIQSMGISVFVLGHFYSPCFPKGHFWSKSSIDSLAEELPGNCIGYLNLPMVRNLSITQGYFSAFEKMYAQWGLPSAIISYNLYPYCINFSKSLNRRWGVPWIPIVADPPNNKHFNSQDLGATAIIYLSWEAYRKSTCISKFHLDGGVSNIQSSNYKLENKDKRSKVVLYSGSLNKYGGVDLLLQAFEKITNPHIELWICGKGDNSLINQSVEVDSRIKFYGFVSEEKIQELYQNADIFVNPRPSALWTSQYNFPSKLLSYLAYCKPVISTWTAGISPDYQNLLIIPKQEDADSLADAIEQTIQFNEFELESLACQIASFLQREKLWTIQGERLLNWLNSTVLKSVEQIEHDSGHRLRGH